VPPKLAFLTAAAAVVAFATAVPIAAAGTGTGWGPVQQLGGTTNDDITSIAVDPAEDQAIGIATYGDDHVLLTARRAGSPWPATQAPITAQAQSTQPSIGPDGTAHVAYVEDGQVFLKSVAPGATTASAPEYVAGESCCDSAIADETTWPQIATGADGATVLAWMANESTYSAVHWAVRAAGASRFGPVRSTPEGARIWGQEHLAADARGDVVIGWVESDGGNTGDPFSVREVSRPAGGTFGAPVTVSGPNHHIEPPAVAVGPDGSAALAWRADTGNGSDGVIRAATRAGAGGAWTAEQDVSAETGAAALPRVAVGGAGGRETAVAYTDSTSQTTSAVVVAALGTAGAPFPAPAPVATIDGTVEDLALGPDGTGILAFSDGSGAADVLTSIRPRGAAAFAYVDPATATADVQPAQGNAEVAFDAAGDALMAWAGRDGFERWRVWDGLPGAAATAAASPAPVTAPAASPAPPAATPVAARPVLATATARKTYRIPSLANLTTARAKAKLRAAHLALGRVTTPRRYRKAHGLVIRSQSRRAGTRASRGAKVNVTLGVKPARKGR
jgi:hypothetical protein